MQKLKRWLMLGALLLSAGAQAADPGLTESSISIGMSAPFSGPNAAYGQDMRQTITAYFEQINQNGGIHGRKLNLIALDDGYETERTLTNTRRLIEELRVFALLAYYGTTPTTESLEKVFGPAKVPLIGAISGADSLRPNVQTAPLARYMFNVRASYADETEAIVNQLVSLGLKSVAVVYQNDGFGKSGLDGVSNALKRHGLKPSATAAIERNATDPSAAAASIAKANPQAVILVTLYKPSAAFVRAMKKAGQNPMFMTLSSVGTEQLVTELGLDARGIGISQVMPYPWNDTQAVVRDYQRLFPKGSGNYSYYGIEAYIMARTLVEGLRRSGREISREKLVGNLESLNIDLGGYRIGFSPEQHLGSRHVELTVIGPGGKVLK